MAGKRLFGSLLLVWSVSISTAQDTTSTLPSKIAIASASASTTYTIPSCAQSCLAAATQSLPCADTDSACLCLQASTVSWSVLQCLTASHACSAADLDSAVTYYGILCKSLGYPTDALDPSMATEPVTTSAFFPATGSASVKGAVTTVSDPPAALATTVNTPSSERGRPDLSNAAVVAIITGSVCVLVISIVAAVFLCLRRRAPNHLLMHEPDDDVVIQPETAEVKTNQKRSTSVAITTIENISAPAPLCSVQRAPQPPPPKSKPKTTSPIKIPDRCHQPSAASESLDSRRADRVRLNPLRQNPSPARSEKMVSDFGLPSLATMKRTMTPTSPISPVTRPTRSSCGGPERARDASQSISVPRRDDNGPPTPRYHQRQSRSRWGMVVVDDPVVQNVKTFV